MNKDVLMAENRAAEAERARASAANKANMLDRQAGEMVKALREALMFIDNPERYKDHEVGALKHMIKAAMATYTSNTLVVSEPKQGFQLFASDPPENPETDNWYWDGKNINWFYLGKWHTGKAE